MCHYNVTLKNVAKTLKFFSDSKSTTALTQLLFQRRQCSFTSNIMSLKLQTNFYVSDFNYFVA